MRLLALVCEAFARPFYRHAATSPHQVDIRLFKIGLHNTPDKLRTALQAAIDDARGTAYDAILLGYGLCGRSTDGLSAREIPLVITRAHDCITLFLGSRARYDQEYQSCPGTYWYTPDYIERRDGSLDTLSIGAMTDVNMEGVYQQYVEKYGQDNADYLMEVMGAWQQHYQRAAFIDSGYDKALAAQEKARVQAEKRGWRYEELPGDESLLKKLLHGEWDDDFVRVMPGQKIRMSAGDQIISAQ